MPREITVTSILNKTKKRDSWFLCDYTINLYSSCSFNCLYCYIRGSKYGTNLEQSLSVKSNAIEVLNKQLSRRAAKGAYGIIVVCSATDPYLQIEAKYELTRQALEVIRKHRFPVHMITKSDLLARDFDILHEIDKTAILPSGLQENPGRGVLISFSFSTVNDEIGKIFEPGATAPSARLSAVKKSVNEGFMTGISMMPMLPYITDTSEHLHTMFDTFKEVGVDYVLPATITLFGDGKADSKTLMLNAVKKHYPHLLEKYERFFAHSTEMPAYYRDAFYRKMKELSLEYDIRNTIMKK